MRPSLPLAVFLLSASLPAVAQEADDRTLAVLPLRIERLQGNDAIRLDDLLRGRAETRARMTLQPADTTATMVDAAQSLGVDCELVSVECAAKFGAVADVEYVLLGTAAGYGPEIGMDLRLVQVSTGAELARAAALLPADFDEQEAKVGVLVAALFVPPDHPLRSGQGVLRAAEVTPEGATVTVDGAPRGQTPITAPITGLVPGAHVVVVSKDGFEPQEVRFEVEARGTHELRTTLTGGGPRARTPFERALPWSVTAVGGALLAAGLVTTGVGVVPFVDAQAAQGQLDALVSSPDPSPSYAAEAGVLYARIEQQKRDWETWGLPAVVVGAAVAGVGVVVTGGGVLWGVLAGDEETVE